ncbi:DNA ligase 4 [Hymenopellis radicata]|nr:DNA ligase 4 [Hymenopellis radicata]
MQATPAPTSAPGSPEPSASQAAISSTPEPPQNFGTAPFGILTGLFEKLSGERKRDRKEKLLNAWFNHWREEKGKDLYPVLRLILPQKDRERAVYGLKEQNLAKTYIKLIPLGPRDPDAIRLTNWKKPTEKDKASGDFPTVLYEVVSKRSSVVESTLTIEDLNSLLDELSENMGSREVQSKILTRVYNRATPEEQRWIARIILKDLVISVKETTVFAVFHPDAQDLYNTCSDLKKVAWTLWDPSFRLNAQDKAVRLFHAFTPMLCSRPTKKIEETVKEMGDKEFFIEEKLDGERMQLHKKGNEYFYCSRKGKDYTYLYGKHVGEGSLTPYVDKAFDHRVDEIILDGEMLVWDPVSQRNLPFGTLKTAAGDKTKKANMPRPCFKVFDLLYLNGNSLLDKSTSYRKKNMRACLKEIPGRIEFAIEFKGSTAADVRQKMDEVMASRGEGLVIKHPLSKYVLNGRNKDWIKVKPEYMDNMGETVDVIVIAGNYGTGSRGGGVSTLVCAVVETGPGADDDDVKYRSFVRIGSGLTYADYLWVRSKPWKKWDPKNPPAFYKTAKKTPEDKGDVYLEPEDSFILKVKAAEIVKSDQYHMGYTMRFPRAVAIRTDLYITDCITDEGNITQSFSMLVNSHDSHRNPRELEDGVKEENRNTKSNKKKTGRTKAKAMVNSDYQGPSAKDITVESDIFNGLKFVVIADPKSRSGDKDKKDMQKLLIANGGRSQMVAPKVNNGDFFVVFMGTVIPYDLSLMIKKGIHDVLKPDWVSDSISLDRQAPLSKRYFVFATEERQQTDEYRMEETPERQEQNVQLKADKDEADSGSRPGPSTNTAAVVPKKEEIDPALAEWLHVDEPKCEEGDMDDWLKVTNDDAEDEHPEIDPAHEDENNVKSEEEPEQVKMGEDETAMEYDTELIFKHLCFYLDSPRNARRHGMSVKSKYERDIDKSFEELEKTVVANGGRIVDLDEPKMTHVVLDKRDDSRRLQLINQTSKPKRRHLIISDFIHACLDEQTLLDEDEFQP